MMENRIDRWLLNKEHELFTTNAIFTTDLTFTCLADYYREALWMRRTLFSLSYINSLLCYNVTRSWES